MGLSLQSRKILIVVFLFFYLPIAYYWGFILMNQVLVDFPSYYHAAHLTFVEGYSPYGLDAFNLVSFGMGRKVNPYLYPPPSLIAFWPLAGLPLLQAQAAFLVVSHLCYLGCVWLILAKLTPLPGDERLREITVGLSLIYIMFFDPALKTLAVGQVNFIALFFICLSLVAIKNGSSAWRIALPLSVAVLLKTYPILLLIPLIFRRQYRAVALTCGLLATFTGISILVLPSVLWRDYVEKILPLGGYANNAISAAFVWNQNINGFVTRLLMPSEFAQAPLSFPFLAKPVSMALAAMVLGVTALFSFRLSRNGDYAGRGDDELAAFLLMMFLVAPLSWDHHLVYVLPAAVLSISLMVSGSVRGKAAIFALMALFAMAWILPIESPEFRHGWWTLLMSLKFYPVVVLWVLFIHRLSRPAMHQDTIAG